MEINNTLKFAFKSYACSHKFYDSFQVRTYTSARLLLEKYSTPVLFHANNYLYGGERYHFCMVEFADTLQGIDTYSKCPAQILGFFKGDLPDSTHHIETTSHGPVARLGHPITSPLRPHLYVTPIISRVGQELVFNNHPKL